jgi:hypothetical protein
VTASVRQGIPVDVRLRVNGQPAGQEAAV